LKTCVTTDSSDPTSLTTKEKNPDNNAAGVCADAYGAYINKQKKVNSLMGDDFSEEQTTSVSDGSDDASEIKTETKGSESKHFGQIEQFDDGSSPNSSALPNEDETKIKDENTANGTAAFQFHGFKRRVH